MFLVCCECGKRFETTATRGRSPKYCGGTCRKRATRARNRSLKRFHALAAGRWSRADVKRPVMASGAPASTTKPETWANFADVQTGAGTGFGVMLGNGLGCVDLDHCFIAAGRLQPWARAAIQATEKPLFIERSVSGEGLHVFCELPEQTGSSVRHNGGAVETFSRARFILVTFDFFRP